MTNDNSPNSNDATRSIEQLTREALGATSSRAFDDGFATRAWSRWNATRMDGNVIALMERSAQRLVPLAVAASLLVALYSAAPGAIASARPQSFVERMLGWGEPEATLQYASASIYDVYGLTSSLGNQ